MNLDTLIAEHYDPHFVVDIEGGLANIKFIPFDRKLIDTDPLISHNRMCASTLSVFKDWTTQLNDNLSKTTGAMSRLHDLANSMLYRFSDDSAKSSMETIANNQILPDYPEIKIIDHSIYLTRVPVRMEALATSEEPSAETENFPDAVQWLMENWEIDMDFFTTIEAGMFPPKFDLTVSPVQYGIDTPKALMYKGKALDIDLVFEACSHWINTVLGSDSEFVTDISDVMEGFNYDGVDDFIDELIDKSNAKFNELGFVADDSTPGIKLREAITTILDLMLLSEST